MRRLTLMVVLMACVAPAWATVTTTGKVVNTGVLTAVLPGTQPDPWDIWGKLRLGDPGEGTLDVEAGGVVFVLQGGCIGAYWFSTGAATITGTGPT